MREMGAPGWAVLAVLADGEERTHAQVIAGCESVFAEDPFDPSTFSRALHRLEEMGFVERYRVHDMWEPWRYRITDAGRTHTRSASRIWERLLTLSAPTGVGAA